MKKNIEETSPKGSIYNINKMLPRNTVKKQTSESIDENLVKKEQKYQETGHKKINL